MTVVVRGDGVIALEGACEAADAEALQRALLNDARTSVEWSACDHLHAAVLQVLLAAGRPVHGTPRSAFLRVHVSALLARLEIARSRGARRLHGETE